MTGMSSLGRCNGWKPFNVLEWHDVLQVILYMPGRLPDVVIEASGPDVDADDA